MSLKMKGTSELKDMTIFTLYNPILLGCINERVLISGAIFSEKILHRKKFPSIIIANICDGCIKLGFDKEKKL